MDELPQHFYERILPLVEASGIHGHLAFVYEMVENRRPGHIYVDQANNPNTTLVCNDNGFYLAFGRPDETLVRPLVEHFFQLDLRENDTSLLASSPEWMTVLGRILDPLGAKQFSRLVFARAARPGQALIPAGFSLEPITEEMGQSILDGTGTGGYGIAPWFIRIAGGPKAYAAPGLGLAFVYQGQIASLCGYCGLSKREAEMEVGTVPAFQGRGLAPQVSTAFLDQCLARGLELGYTCDSKNQASIKVAHKIGFVEIEEIHGYQLYKEN